MRVTAYLKQNKEKLTMLHYKFKVIDPIGFHARPAAKLVEVAKKFPTEAVLEYGGKTASLKSIISLMALGIGHESEVTITFRGPEAEACLVAVQTVIETEKLGQGI